MASKIANAYVQIIPSAEGIAGKIKNVLNGEAQAAGESSGKTIANAIKTAISVAAIGSAIKSSIEQGAALEQSLGGVETLFKENADKVIENAERAFKTAGLSANDYMETVTSFSASLLQGLGNDTEKAAQYADMAIISMSDNANKFGTSMESIQNAYQGFAKQNYTMLDNLKLGYGGTKTEMERLIKEASTMTAEMEKLGVSVDADSMSFDNIVTAIAVVQEHMGVAGTTADEAAETISGSAAAMKAAFQNVLAYLTTGNNIQPAVKNLIDTTMVFAQNNLFPALQNIIGAIPTLIIGLIDSLPQSVQTGIELVVRLIQGLISAIPKIIESIPQLVSAIWNGIKSVDWADLGRNILYGIKDGLVSVAWALGNAAKEAAQAALGKVKDFLGIHSPSTVFRDEVGKMMGLGIAEGIDAEANAVSRSIDALAKSTVGTFDSNISVSGTPASSATGDNIVSALYAVANMIITAIRDKDSSIVIDSDAIGKAATKYINSQNRRRGIATV